MLRMERVVLGYKKALHTELQRFGIYILVFYINNLIGILKRFYQKQLLLWEY